MSPKNPTIKLIDAARHYAKEPHQDAAWSILQDKIPADALSEFAALYRAGPPSKPSPSVTPAWLAPASAIIREFEGCRLNAYQCSSGVWTIGWGSTQMPVGGAVRFGDRVTQEQADRLLDQQIRQVFGPGVAALINGWSKLNANAQAALIGWAFNVGLGAVKDSTLRRRLNNGEDPITVAREELPRWNKDANGSSVGLTRRRAAEVALFTAGSAVPKPQPPSIIPTSPFTTKITPNFTLGEFALNQEARRFKSQHQIATAILLAEFLEKLRAQFKNPVVITSGYRPPLVNTAVGGAINSEHLYNAVDIGAVDVYVDGVPIKQVQDWIDKSWPYSVGYGAPKGFVHVGIRFGRPRVRWDY